MFGRAGAELNAQNKIADEGADAQVRDSGLTLQVPVLLFVHPDADMAVSFSHGVILS